MFTYPIALSYTLKDATNEIFLMLLVTAILSFLLGWLFKNSLCSHRNCTTKKDISYSRVALTENEVNKKDDLKLIEGIGPKMEEVLNSHHIHTFKQLAQSQVETLQNILNSYGGTYQIIDPGTWSKQAEMAQFKKWPELQVYQEYRLEGCISNL